MRKGNLLCFTFLVFFSLGAAEKAGGLDLSAGVGLGLTDTETFAKATRIIPELGIYHNLGELSFRARFNYFFVLPSKDDDTSLDSQAARGSQKMSLEERIVYYDLAPLTVTLTNVNVMPLVPLPEDTMNKLTGALDIGASIGSEPLYGVFGRFNWFFGVPIVYMTPIKDDKARFDAYLAVENRFSTFGHKLTLDFGLSPESGYNGFKYLLFLRGSSFSAELEARGSKDFENFVWMMALQFQNDGFLLRGEALMGKNPVTEEGYFIPTIWIKYSKKEE